MIFNSSLNSTNIWGVFLATLLLLATISFPIKAQDAISCSGEDFLERVDGLNAEYREARTPNDDLAAFIATEEYHTLLGEIVEECRSIVEITAAGVTEIGSGTLDDPYAFNYFADVIGDTHWKIRVSRVRHPAERYFRSPPPDGYNRLVISLDVQCVSPEHIFCEMSTAGFQVFGSNAVVYDNDIHSYSSSSRLSVKLAEGGKGSGNLAYNVEEGDTKLILMRSLGWNAEPVFFSLEPDPGQIVDEPDREIAITSTTSLNIRTGPGRFNQRVGVLRNGEQATAIGRNDSGTWVQIDKGWVFAQYVNADGNIMALPVTSN